MMMIYSGIVLLLVLIAGFYELQVALGALEQHAQHSAAALVKVEIACDHIQDRLSLIDADLAEIRARVAPPR